MRNTTPFQRRGWRNNLVVNGNFDIHQRILINAVATYRTADFNGVEAADHWRNIIVLDGGATPATGVGVTVTDSLGGGGIMTPNAYTRGSSKTLQVDAGAGASSLGNDGYQMLVNRIENGVQSVLAPYTNITLTFIVYGDTVAGAKIGCSLLVNNGTGGSASTIIKGQSWTLTNHVITVLTYTFIMPQKAAVVAADNYLELRFFYARGANVAAANFTNDTTADLWKSGAVYLAQVHLEYGELSTPFLPNAIGDELVACQRYFQRFNPLGAVYQVIGSAGFCDGATTAIIPYPLKPPMYAAPTPTQKGNLALLNNVAALQAVTAIGTAATGSGPMEMRLNTTVAANLTVGFSTVLLANNSATGDVWLEAEVT